MNLEKHWCKRSILRRLKESQTFRKVSDIWKSLKYLEKSQTFERLMQKIDAKAQYKQSIQAQCGQLI